MFGTDRCHNDLCATVAGRLARAAIISNEALTFSWKKLTIAAMIVPGRLRRSVILQEPLDVIELLLRTQHVAKPPPQLLDNAAGALHVDLARHFHREIVAVIAAVQRPAERISIALCTR